ncbi:hypothetical protein DN730_12190 [Marinomonas piezotolerans]|uniref:Tetratricopeptide repeat protein n=1 Tax=Marinomonas piezotolerans TaxID=2213058 RepID=A0A370U849_9GAMM|nr:hypothetical protein [Marinomonas piezotolerans]RDL43935.1 hypothetical protein DN730_12190 [Marinomonas piezotolerans]
MFKKAFFLLTLPLFLAACAGTPVPNASPTTVTPEDSEGSVVDQGDAVLIEQNDTSSTPVETVNDDIESSADKVTRRLIRQGEYALSEQRLLTPEEDNANMYFQIALGRDPGNYEAIIGIAAIVDTYLEWAVASAERQQYSKAEEYVANANFVSPDDPSIEETEERIKQIRARHQSTSKKASQKPIIEASEDIFILPKDLFQLSDDEILAKMQPIIDRVTKTQRAIDINWPSDKEGRLIYQIINSRTPEFRVRAMIFHRARYTVEVN